ncbi:PaREP1 family protein [Ignisphaera sp. 4213-co]|uniref:PaREP1 family protein n=1 Tax=Ignisphaera cupida TaxID=3050454 RepID=A0ABD4Z3M7_9CREN|nr:PaREP1 family protein [Ignisphaera sp. 4213-co]MDK6027916.1 PaREP1 family protein [Ignisphaera sp. 4213-co]
MYWDMAEEYLRRAKEDFSKGDFKQASEKILGVTALAVKAVAYMRSGSRLKSHGELWEYVNKLVIETSDEKLGRLWRTAISMHVNFYKNWASREEVERSLKDVEKFLEKLKKLCGK